MMTPAYINILLWIHCRGEDYNGDLGKNYVADAIVGLCGLGLVKEGSVHDDVSYSLTPMGSFYVEALCSLPLPVIKFEIPNTQDQ